MAKIAEVMAVMMDTQMELTAEAAVDDAVRGLPRGEAMITRSQAVAVLQAALPHIASIRQAALFGSFARDEATPSSDVDVLAIMQDGLSLVDLAFARSLLERATGREVDLVCTYRGLSEPMIRAIEREAIRVY